MLKRLAEIVIEAQLASRESVLAAARTAERENIPLVAILVERGGIDELALVTAIRKQVRVPLADPGTVETDPEAIRELPQALAQRLRVMPLALSLYDADVKLLKLAMADPTDAMAIAEVEHVSGCRVEGYLMPLSAIEELIANGYRAFVTEVISRPPQRAREPVRKSVPDEFLVGHDTHRITLLPAAEFGPDIASAANPDESSPPSTAHTVVTSESAAGTDKAVPPPTTVPFHRIADEASLALRHRALLQLLIDKGLVTESEYEDRIRLLMRQHTEDS